MSLRAWAFAWEVAEVILSLSLSAAQRAPWTPARLNARRVGFAVRQFWARLWESLSLHSLAGI
jgi:hypothetical protein